MIDILIKALFWIVTQLYNIIFTPIFSIIFALFPGLTSYFNHIISFLQLALTYVRTCLALLLINDNMILTIFNYFIILYTIHITLLIVRFAVNIYNKFKM